MRKRVFTASAERLLQLVFAQCMKGGTFFGSVTALVSNSVSRTALGVHDNHLWELEGERSA